MDKKYYLCFSGVAIAGMGADDMEPEIFYGTAEQARGLAYEKSLEMAGDFFDEEGEDFNAEDETDYYEEVITNKELHNWGGLMAELKLEVVRHGHNFEEICKEYGLEETDN